ncbi:hypothetical protein J2W46_006585 [Paraburkholderia strydomiana]|uniref:hypothetical protein n=1 Tax=Paraburkholderia strydomiana TaxID=1245417 RepID=UPI00285D0C13|nr:hypothetical protein [Paraburkholderia strydomiana]
MKLIDDDAWQQFVDAIEGMFRVESDDTAHVGFGIEAIPFREKSSTPWFRRNGEFEISAAGSSPNRA